MRARIFLPASLGLFVLVATYGAQADNCECEVTASAPEGVVIACPQGDGTALGASGLTVSVTLFGCGGGVPTVGMPADSIRLVACNVLSQCGGSWAGIPASAPTDANGHTTITGAFTAGGCDLGGVRVYAQYSTEGPIGGGVVYCWSSCLPIKVKSVDITGDVRVDLADFAAFGADYASPPKPYNECVDYWAPFGVVALNDFVAWAVHYQHAC